MENLPSFLGAHGFSRKPSSLQPSTVTNQLCCDVLSHSACLTPCTPWTLAHQAPLSMGFSKQRYWSGLPCPPPGDIPSLGIKPRSPTLQMDSSLSEAPGKPYKPTIINKWLRKTAIWEATDSTSRSGLSIN